MQSFKVLRLFAYEESNCFVMLFLRSLKPARILCHFYISAKIRLNERLYLFWIKPHGSTKFYIWQQAFFHHVLNFSSRDCEVFGNILFAPIAVTNILFVVHDSAI